MRVKGMLIVGFLTVMAGTGTNTVPESFASDAHKVDMIDAFQETVAQADSVKAGSERMRVDVIESLESEGPGYSYTKPMSH